MMERIETAHVTSSSTDTTWSQTYSTLNLYIVLRVFRKQSGETLASVGKEILEQLQREYFAEDTKTLSTIKEAVSRTVSQISNEVDYSLVLATVSGEVTYVVIAQSGAAILRRGDEIGYIGQGEGDISVFSGKMKAGDVLILCTSDFLTKVPIEKLSTLPSHLSVHDMSEDITPVVHEGPTGGESAVFLQMFGGDYMTPSSVDEIDDSVPEIEEEAIESEPVRTKLLSIFSYIPKLSIPPFLLRHKRRVLAGVGILALVLLLAVNLVMDRKTDDAQNLSEEFAGVRPEIEEYITEAETLSDLNASLALDNLMRARDIIAKIEPTYPEGSAERDQIEKYREQINDLVRVIEGGVSLNDVEVFFDGGANDLENARFVSLLDGNVVVFGEAKGALLNDEGEVENDFSVNSDIELFSVGENVFASGDGAVYLFTGNGESSEVFDLPSDARALASYGGNAYVVQGRDIVKYSPSSYGASNYLVEDESLTGDATSVAIDGSVYVLYSDGSAQKFLRGSDTGFSLQSPSTPLGDTSLLYTTSELSSLYILDPGNKRLVVYDKDGVYESMYFWDGFSSATSFFVNSDKELFVASDGKVYKASLE